MNILWKLVKRQMNMTVVSLPQQHCPSKQLAKRKSVIDF